MPILLAFILIFFAYQIAPASPRHMHYRINLSSKDQEFSQKLSRRQRKIFCIQFNQSQREKAIKYASQGEKNPDEAVIRVMEETGMPLATKKRQENVSQR